MYMLTSFDCKFKTNKENIERILQHYGLRKIQSSLYAGDLNNDERKNLCKNISKIIQEKDNVLIIPVCESCYSKKGFVEILFDFCKNFLKIYFYFYFYL